jgi:hypothetical protein
MFEYVYQIAVVIFLLQGVLIPFILLVSGLVWWRQSRQLERLLKEVGAGRPKSDGP